MDTVSTYLASYIINGLFFRKTRPIGGQCNVMVFKLDNAGDVVLSSLVMPRVVEMLGNARVVYVVKKGLSGLLSHVDCVSDVIEVPAGLGHCSGVASEDWRAIRASRNIIRQAIAEYRPQVIIDLRPTSLGNYGAVVGFLKGARYRFSLERQRIDEVLGRDRGMKWRRHEVETFCQALRDGGVLPASSDYRPLLTFWSVAPEKKSIPIGKYFLLQPGAVWDYKRWPERHYASLMDSLSEHYPGHSFILTGSASENAVCSRVVELTGKKTKDRIINLAGKTSIEELISLIAGAEMVIANDSGVAHIAGAAGVRTVVFFGPSSPERFMPLSERQDRVKVFHHRLPCNPCDQFACVEGPASYCLTRVNSKEVAEYILSVLPREEPHAADTDLTGRKHANL